MTEKRSEYDKQGMLAKDKNRVTIANKVNDKESPSGEALPGNKM
ncbi:hypothetical protein HanPI659440_Chr15g0592321 [Helianthus annuus]|nr:hypothetical protein HanPI659440_Chr15g0592321 [Helianthus annuus]